MQTPEVSIHKQTCVLWSWSKQWHHFTLEGPVTIVLSHVSSERQQRQRFFIFQLLPFTTTTSCIYIHAHNLNSAITQESVTVKSGICQAN